MAEQEYNGWTNYETWLVKLWVDNDQGSHQYWQESAEYIYQEAEADNNFSKDERAKLTLADRLREEHKENMPIEESGVYADLLNASLSRVNWHEIAQDLLDDIEKEQD